MKNEEKKSLATIMGTVFVTVLVAQLLTYVFAISTLQHRVERHEETIPRMEQEIIDLRIHRAVMLEQYNTMIEKLERIERMLNESN